MKIAVIGYSGAGKSTLAKTLSEIYGCPLLYLDTVQFEADWKERDREAACQMVASFMNNSQWVIDGNYYGFYQQQRLEQADKIVFLNFPRLVCLKQAVTRYLKYRNTTRESMSQGCKEKFDFEFFIWIIYKGRTRSRRSHFDTIVEKYQPKVVVLKNRRQVNEYINNTKEYIIKTAGN